MNLTDIFLALFGAFIFGSGLVAFSRMRISVGIRGIDAIKDVTGVPARGVASLYMAGGAVMLLSGFLSFINFGLLSREQLLIIWVASSIFVIVANLLGIFVSIFIQK